MRNCLDPSLTSQAENSNAGIIASQTNDGILLLDLETLNEVAPPPA